MLATNSSHPLLIRTPLEVHDEGVLESPPSNHRNELIRIKTLYCEITVRNASNFSFLYLHVNCMI